MSEDERDIDVELDDGDGDLVGMDDDGNSIIGEDGIPENKRALHNAMERKRRDSIKDSFRGLQECIPTLRGDKTSRAQVLKKTGDYIVHMQKKINNHTDEIKSLKEQNSALEQQIKALEKAKAQGNFVSGDLLEVEHLMSGELELGSIEGSEIVYDDTSSDTSGPLNDCQTVTVLPGEVEGLQAGARVPQGPARVTVVPPPGARAGAMALPSSSAPLAMVPKVSVVQGVQGTKSLLATNIRVAKPGQSLLLSEPLRKKMKF